ncbi:putative Phosphoglycerate mutase-like protein [metagenome]|uniref:Putative Phosphoglycerate mutase-like protein n=1 Tax=metagenome TaxID=256318 RepID=A0A2P2C2F6_9ZZZZ
MIVLVRHGQASWGTDDYDVLSPLGEAQAAVVGAELAGLSPALVVHGLLRRQRQTAEAAMASAGWDCPVRVDPAWDEVDMDALLEVTPRPFEGEPDARQFQQWYEHATLRWAGAEHEYAESYAAFQARVLDGLRSLVGERNAVVFTSGGPIAVVTANLLDGGVTSYVRLAPVVVNTSITRVLTGRRGPTLLTFNDHGHLAQDQLTYR